MKIPIINLEDLKNYLPAHLWDNFPVIKTIVKNNKFNIYYDPSCDTSVFVGTPDISDNTLLVNSYLVDSMYLMALLKPDEFELMNNEPPYLLRLWWD